MDPGSFMLVASNITGWKMAGAGVKRLADDYGEKVGAFAEDVAEKLKISTGLLALVAGVLVVAWTRKKLSNLF